MLLVVGLILFIFILGAGTGVVFMAQKNAPKFKIAARDAEVVKNLSSKTVPSIVAYGKVEKIEGKNITLAFSGDTITVPIAPNAHIFSLRSVVDKTNGSSVQDSSFEKIKNGDTLSINLKLLADGTMQGSTINILIPASNTAK